MAMFADILALYPNALSERGGYAVPCPCAGHGDHDKGPAANIAAGHAGNLLAHCSGGCPQESVYAAFDALVSATTTGSVVGQKNDAAIVSAPDLLAKKFAEIVWVVPGLLLQGSLTILASKPKLGKTFFSFGIVLAIASGGVALGAIEVEQGDALYLALEDGERRMQARLRRMLARDKVPPRLFLAWHWPRLDEGGIEALQNWITEHPKSRLVVVDTLKRVRAVESGKARIYDDDYNALGPLADLAHKNNIAILVLHHTRKLESADPLDLVSGSFGLSAAADAVLVMTRLRGRAEAVLHAQSRDFEDKELALTFDKDSLSWRILGDAAEFQKSDERKAVIEVLKESGPLAPKAVADLLGKSYSATKKLLWTMSGCGELHTSKKGIYSVPDTGAADEEIEAENRR